jgi:putative ABC transport system permease protein
MLKNYLKVAIRNLGRSKGFSLINILGLALGMTCSLLILLWVNHEKSIDGQHANKSRLYAIYERQYHDGQIDAGYFTPGLLPAELKKVLPEIEYSSGSAWNDLSTFEVGDKILKQTGNHASADFFTMFSHPLLEGTPQTALHSPLSIAISRKMSEDFFGSPQAAIGKTIRYENRSDLQVSAVFENITDNNSSKFDYLINWEFFLENHGWAKEWGNNGPRTYVMLRADANVESVKKKIRKFLDNYNKDQSANFYIELGLQPFNEIYLRSNFKNGQIEGGRIEYVKLFSLVAVFILLIACINFMNLTTARSVKRSKEIGIRKVAGAVRFVLVKQFIGEAVMLTFFAVIVSFLLITLLLPAFNILTGKEIQLPVNQPTFWLSVVGLTLATGFVSGSYPALFLSGFQPIKVLKGGMKFSSGATLFRKGLVVFQFILSIILIIGTIIVSKQIDYVQQVNLGYERENLVFIPLDGDLTGKYRLFKEQVSSLPEIKMVTRMTQNPTELDNGTHGVEWEGKDPNSAPQFTQTGVGYDFAKTMNLQVLMGRDLSKDFASDSVGYLVNETALRIIKYKDPIGKPLTFWEKKGTIVGVIKDFHFASLHEPIRPLVIRLMETDGWGTALVRIKAGKTKQALTGLEKICKELNPKFPFTYQFADEEYQKLYQSEQVVGKISNSFAILAIFISCLGLLGLAMFTAEQRTKEFGIRKVLGASIHSLFSLLSKDFLILVLIAFVIASPLAWIAMNNWLQDFAYRINITWWMFVAAGIIALAIALLTVSFQAIKAALMNPVNSLRTE